MNPNLLSVSRRNFVVLTVFIGVFVGVLISGCGNYNEIKIPFETSGPMSNEKVEIDFSDIKVSFLQTSCVSCHGQFESYAGVIANLSAIESSILSDRMPKFGPPLSDDQKALFNAWVAAGAPEFVGPEE